MKIFLILFETCFLDNTNIFFKKKKQAINKKLLKKLS
jgi:hypothetical protein